MKEAEGHGGDGRDCGLAKQSIANDWTASGDRTDVGGVTPTNAPATV